MRPHHTQRPESRSHAHQEAYKKPLNYRCLRIAVVMPMVSPLEHFHCSTFFDSLLALLPEREERAWFQEFMQLSPIKHVFISGRVLMTYQSYVARLYDNAVHNIQPYGYLPW